METPRPQATEATTRTLDHELDLIRSAISMVASGGANRVTLGSLRFGEELLEQARDLAREAGVRIVPLWSGDETGVGIAVERMTDDGA